MCCQNKKQLANVTVDYLVCTCMGVMRSDIVAAIEKGDNSFEKLSESLLVGTGCSSCIAEVEDILQCTSNNE